MDCANLLQYLATRNQNGREPRWTPEDTQRYWALMEYLNGVLMFYARHADREQQLKRSVDFINSLSNAPPELKEQLRTVRLSSHEQTLSQFKLAWKKILDEKYPDLRLFHLDEPEKDCVAKAAAFPTRPDPLKEFHNRDGARQKEARYPWEKVPR